MQFLFLLFGCLFSFISLANSSVLGIGTTCTDFIIHVDETFLQQNVRGDKGGAFTIPLEEFDAILNAYNGTVKILPGGSSANTIRGIARLGQSCIFYAYAGTDVYGKYFIDSLQKCGVTDCVSLMSNYTGPRVLCMITPDGDRTMRILKGPQPDWKFLPENFHNVRLVFIEGYGISNGGIEKAMKLAKEANCKIAMDLASFEIVLQKKELFHYLLSKYIDIVFANEKEIEALTGLPPEEGCLKLQEICPLVVVTLGDQGCLIGHHGEVNPYPAFSVKVIDSTGAGDHFASGFLHGYLEGYPLSLCAKIGNFLGSNIVTVEGTSLSEEKWESIHDFLKRETLFKNP